MLRWLAIAAVAMAAPGPAGAEPFRIALVGDANSIEAQHAERGFRLGLDDASQRTPAAGGRALEVTSWTTMATPRWAVDSSRKPSGSPVPTSPSA